MKIKIKRFSFQDHATIGRLSVNDRGSLFTLEPKVRPFKVPGKTAIPCGTYNVTINWSQHFKRWMPLLENVPNFQGVRIHCGNTDADSEGCILVGKSWNGSDFVGQSREAFTWLFDQIHAAIGRHEPVTIEIVSNPMPSEQAA